MDAVISIGGQSFVDGLVRILGPGIQALRSPMPIALPGLGNGLATIRSIRSKFPGGGGTIAFELEIDLTAEVLLVASVAAETINLTPGTGSFTIPATPSVATLVEQARSAALSLDPITSAVNGTVTGAPAAITGTIPSEPLSLTGPVAGAPVTLTGTIPAAALNLTETIPDAPVTLNLSLNGVTGSVNLPSALLPIDLNQIVGTIQLPGGTGNLALPLPAVVPVAVNFTQDAPITARVFLPPFINNSAVGGADVHIDASSGFGLEFSVGQPTVQVDPIPAAVVTVLQTALKNAFNTLTTQLGVSALTQPGTNFPTVVTDIAAALPAAATATLTDAFAGLRARTGRLIYPPPPPGSPFEISLRPADCRARLTVGPGGSPILQVGFDRASIPPGTPFPPAPVGPVGILTIDTGVNLTNGFVLGLLASIIEKFPNLSLPTPAVLATAAPPLTATWTGATLTVGPLAFTGTLTLTIAGTPSGTGTPTPKTVTLAFGPVTVPLPVTVPAIPIATIFGFTPFSFGPILVIPTVTAGFTAPISFDLNGVASITGLRPTAAVTPTFALGLAPLIAALRIAAVPFALFLFFAGLGVGFLLGSGIGGILGGIAGALVGVIAGAVVALVFLAVTALVTAVVLLVGGIVSDLLGGSLGQVLGGLHSLLESPAALPPGIFEAFGEFVQTTMVVDDLTALGNLRTPTSPWAVLPLFFQQ
jgi:hypothetical protein